MKELNTNQQSSEESLARLLKLAGPRTEPSVDIRQDVYDKVHAAWQAQTQRRNRLRYLLPAAVAATVIAVIAVLQLPQMQPAPLFAGPVGQFDRGGVEFLAEGVWRELQIGDQLTANAIVRTGAQKRAGVILTDGVSLRLDYNTQLQFESAGRIALEHGRLYVDTAEQLRPTGLVVVTATAVVRDIGTQFEVTVDNAQTQVRVRDGEVVLDAGSGDYHAVRGQLLSLDSNGRIYRSDVASNDPSWQWANDVAPFFDTDGRRVSELIDWVARETGRETDFADAMTRNAAASTRIVGSVSGNTPEETLDLALATTRFKYHIDEQLLTIEKHY